MKNLKKLSRNELKNVYGGKLPEGIGCSDVCSPGDGFCEQYGLACVLWFHEAPDGSIPYACKKCA